MVLALHALDSNSPGPAIENAFAAMELAVKAEMYLIEDNPTRQHPQRLAWWTDWEQHGNSPAGSSAVLGLLYAQRGSARYGDRPIELSEPEIAAAIADVEQTIEHASDRTKPIVG
jgi:enamine deaminase RidA (YjgF/YER057c/UK114 family)